VTIASRIDGRTRHHVPGDPNAPGRRRPPVPRVYPALPADPDPAWWRESAACRQADPELFFPISSIGRGAVEAQQAKAVCARCPVRPRCLDFALATGQEFGIWGGYDERELRLLRREGRAAATEVPESAG
jgi:WhiB family transcriptional regulator, redox-sensing transcriptional regulator